MQFIRKTVLGALLVSTGLNVNAQIQPSAAPAALPSGQALPSGVSIPGQARPGQAPANTTAPRSQQGTTQTSGTRTQQGAQTQGQGQATQQNGRGQQGQGGTGTGQPGINSVQASDSTVSESERLQQTQTAGEALRQQELLDQRRKLFGYSVFNDPRNQASFQPNINIATPKGYVIGSGDELNINIYGFSEANYSVPVTPDGFVYIERVGPIHVAGLTIEQAKGRITERLSKIYVGLKNSSYGAVNTYLVVTLGDLRSIRVTVTGDAVQPGTYTISSLSTALNAIYQAGGPNEIGSYRAVQIIRNNRVIATLDLYDYLTTGIQRNDVRLQDNDNIRFTTYKSHIELTGNAKRNNIFEMLPGETLQRLLDLAGGFTSNAYKARIKITRFTNRELKVVDVTEPNFATFVMQDGDEVQIQSVLARYENQISIQGAVFRPGNYSLDQNKTLKQLIADAEGLREDAFTGRINILRTRDDMAVENISLNLANIINGVDPDVELKREDQVVIPSRFDMAELAAISITGEINKPIDATPYVANMTLEDLLLKAGGLRESAAAAQIEVVRRKKDVDISSTSAQIAQIYKFNVSRDLSINPGDSKFQLEPFDQVIVRRSPNYQAQTYANVEGEVMIPGQYPLEKKDQRISDIIKMAGGLSPYAYVEGATLIRTVNMSPAELNLRQQAAAELANDTPNTVVSTSAIVPQAEEPIGINLKRIMSNPGSAEDMILQEDDVLRIPKKLETVRVGGEVLLPTTTKYRGGQTFQDYISQAGGFTARSARKRAYVIYANGSADRTRKFAFFNLYPRVEPGAQIIVPQKLKTALTPLQVIQSTTGIVGSVLTLITTVLLFRSIR